MFVSRVRGLLMGEQNNILKVLAITVCLMAIGCAKHQRINHKKMAPTKASEVGVLYKASSEDKVDELLSTYETAELRPLNTKHLMYEVSGVSLQEVSELDPNGIAQMNKVYAEKKSTNIAPQQPSLQQQVEQFLRSCLNKDKLEYLRMEHAGEPQHGSSYDVSQVVHIDNGKFSPITKSMYVIGAPDGSNITPEPKYSKNLQFAPDMAGVYSVLQFAKDPLNNCYNSMAEVVVTSNPEYIKTQGRAVEELTPSMFFQLKSIDAERAWKSSQGEGTVIAIIDTGVNYNHPSLSPNIAVNDGEIPNNGIDDDKNGMVDDYIGYDFVYNDDKPFDDQGHGSHVAGLAASFHFGVAPRAKILPIKSMSAQGTGDLGSIAAGILYAVDRGADVINLSLSHEGKPQPLLNLALKYAERSGVVVIAAAGNGDGETGLGYSLDSRPTYPANYGYSNVITVAASSEDTLFTSYTNYSNSIVDVVAPGGSHQYPLLSAYIYNPKNYMLSPSQGTSMAAPVTAGVVGLIKSISPELTPSEVRDILLQSGPTHPDLGPVAASSRQLNALSAVMITKAQMAGSLMVATAP